MHKAKAKFIRALREFKEVREDEDDPIAADTRMSDISDNIDDKCASKTSAYVDDAVNKKLQSDAPRLVMAVAQAAMTKVPIGKLIDVSDNIDGKLTVQEVLKNISEGVNDLVVSHNKLIKEHEALNADHGALKTALWANGVNDIMVSHNKLIKEHEALTAEHGALKTALSTTMSALQLLIEKMGSYEKMAHNSTESVAAVMREVVDEQDSRPITPPPRPTTPAPPDIPSA